jgi:hypothetical protein
MTSITDHDKFVINAIFNSNFPLDFNNILPSDSVSSSENNGQSHFFAYTVLSYLTNSMLLRTSNGSQTIRRRR